MDGINLPEGDKLTEHLNGLGDKELADLRKNLVARFDELEDGAKTDAEKFEEIKQIQSQIMAVNDVTTARETEQAERSEELAKLRASVKESEIPASENDEEGTSGTSEEAESDSSEDAKESELVAAGNNDAITASVAAAVGETMKAFAGDYLKPAGDLNQRLRLGTIAQYAPDAKVKEARSEAVITASADIPGFTQGGQITNIEDLGKAMHARARMLPVSTSGKPQPAMIASLQREFTFNLDENATPQQMNEILQAASDPEILTASGGWCAPSEISYDFFNIVCIDGMIDLPTFGVSRGGIQYPTSPSFGDLAGIPGIGWTWTEQDDIEAADSSSIFKPCVHLECPTFVNRRKDCDGFCVEAGNLVDFAYPELVTNWINIVMAIRAKATNARIIDLMLNGGGSGDPITPSVPVNHTGLIGDTTSQLLQSVELSAIDYREKYSMCEDAPLEVKMPRIAKAAIRADLANRDGIDVFAVTDGMIADWFNLRNVNLQYVGDWQVRGTGEPGGAIPLEEWPETLDYLIYAPGTFTRGNGMSLDLGVVRDSTLNATNDHTAAWAEDCYLLAKPGHESRVVTVRLCGAGEIGARVLECAGS